MSHEQLNLSLARTHDKSGWCSRGERLSCAPAVAQRSFWGLGAEPFCRRSQNSTGQTLKRRHANSADSGAPAMVRHHSPHDKTRETDKTRLAIGYLHYRLPPLGKFRNKPFERIGIHTAVRWSAGIESAVLPGQGAHRKQPQPLTHIM